MSLVSDAIESILHVSNPAIRRALARGLRLSYESSGGVDDLPVSANDVLVTTGISAALASRHNVLLSKLELARYLSELGLDLSKPAIRKRLSTEEYQRRFDDGRPQVRNGRRSLYSYAEGRRFFDVVSRVELGAENDQNLAIAEASTS